jgi:predicted Zn-dependent protease
VAALGVALPLRLPGVTSGASTDACLTLSDRLDLDRVPLAVIQQCLRVEPDDVNLVAELGARDERLGDAGAAEQAYRRALALEPGYADLRLRLAKLLLARGAVADAREQAAAALRSQPNRAVVRALLARIDAAAGGAR